MVPSIRFALRMTETRTFAHRWTLLLTMALAVPHPAVGEEQAAAGRFITVSVVGTDTTRKSGIPQPDKAARITVSLRDPASGFAMGGVGVAAWIVPDDGQSCEDWYARVGRVGELPANVIPLLGFDIVQATQDHRLALVDPLLDLASANIRSVTTLPAPIKAWSVAADGQTLAIIDAATGAFSLIEPASGSVHPVALPAPVHALASDDKGFWAGLDNGQVLAISPDGTLAPVLPLGQSPVMIIPAPLAEPVALSADGHARRLGSAEGPAITFPGPVRGGAIAPLANSLFALSEDGQHLYVTDLDNPETSARIALGFPADRIAANPSGRWIALADKAGATIAILDTQTMRVRWTIAMPDPVVEMTFSDAFLYLMHRHQGGVTRVIFDPDGSAPGLAAIAAGVASDEPQTAGPLPRLVRIPAGGVLVASNRERRAYIVSESGAQAAMAMVPLRAGLTAGVVIRQRGMLPGATRGTYTGRFTAPAAGSYKAIIRTDAPEMLQCQNFTVGSPSPRQIATAKPAQPASGAMSATVEGNAIRIRLSGGVVSASRAMLMHPGGGWRQFLTPDKTGTDVILPMPQPLPPPGPYQLYVEVTRADGASETLNTTLDWKGPQS